jgi:adenylate cyclase
MHLRALAVPFRRSTNGGRRAALLTLAFVVIGMLWGGFLGLRHIAGAGSFLDGVENLTIDWRFRLAGPRPAPHGVVIAAIDDEAVREAGGYPPSREALAKMVRGLGALQPRAVAVDVAFLETAPLAADEQLAAALGATRSVIGAVGLFERGARNDRPVSTDLARVPHPSHILWPAQLLRDASKAGLVNLAIDTGVPRFLPMIYRDGAGVAFSFVLATAAAALNVEPEVAHRTLKLSKEIVGTDLGYHLPIRFYGPRGSFRQFSAARILRGELTAAEVRGRVVLLGVTASDVADVYATPFDRAAPGVEILATGIANLLAGDGLVRSPPVRRIDAGAAIALPCIAVLLMARRRALAGLSAAALLYASWAAVSFVAFLDGYWLSVALPLAALFPVAFVYGAAQQALERYAADRLTAANATLIRFQSPALLEHILKAPAFLETPVELDVAVVFLDLSGFVGVAEALGAMGARDFLAEFQAIVERDVAAHDGFVASFMGDGAMILFGLPEPRPDDARRAMRAALTLRVSVGAWLGGLTSIGQSRLSVRIGGHFGPAVASRLGSARHQHIAATGDTVNVASRLLEVGKERRCTVIVSEDLFAAADLPLAACDPIPESLMVEIRGRAQPLRVRTWP